MPGPFKVFRPLMLVIPRGVEKEVRWRNDKRGVYGIELRLDDESYVDFDFSDWIAEDGTIRTLVPAKSISPIQIDDFRVGITGIQASSIFAKWYDTTFTPRLVIEGWQRHGNLIPFDEIVPNLIYRDVALMHDYRYTCMFPSWDVCLTLPVYLLLCEDIPDFEVRLSDVTELGDQIRKSLKGISAGRKQREVEYQNLESFLEKLHSLEDELSLALNAIRSGYDVRFGERGGPDLYVNSVPCELKSRFPVTDGEDIEVRVPENFTILDIYRLFILEIKQAERALRKSRIFFNNLSRTGAGMAYTAASDQERKKGKPPFRGFYEMQTSLRVMIHLALELQKEGEKAIVPYTRYVGPDSRYMIPIPIPLTKFQEAKELEYPRGRNRSSST